MTQSTRQDWLVYQRLAVLQLAEMLGNVSAACRHVGMDRTSFYTWRQRYLAQGLAGLQNLPPVPKHHPYTTPAPMVDRIQQLALLHPQWGCARISAWLTRAGTKISSPTVQNILLRHGLGTLAERSWALETQHLQERQPLDAEQVAFLEKFNPCFRERQAESAHPGQVLAQGSISIGSLAGIGRIYLHAVVDTHNSLVFSCLQAGWLAEDVLALLAGQVLPFYQARQLPVKTLVTDEEVEFDSRVRPVQLFLALNRIEHRPRPYRTRPNGFLERFQRIVRAEFLHQTLRCKPYRSLRALRQDHDEWLHHYNHERAQPGYRNMGRRPIESLEQFLQKV